MFLMALQDKLREIFTRPILALQDFNLQQYQSIVVARERLGGTSQ